MLSIYECKYMSALWQTQPHTYMRRYERANKPAGAFAEDMRKYADLREEVRMPPGGGGGGKGGRGGGGAARLPRAIPAGHLCRGVHAIAHASSAPASTPASTPCQVLAEDGASNVRWLRLDASTLKQQLVEACDGWLAAFQGLLATTVMRQLGGLEQELGRLTAALAGTGGRDDTVLGDEGAEGPKGEASGGDGGEAAPAPMMGEQQAQALQVQVEGEHPGVHQRLVACRDMCEVLAGVQASRGAGPAA